MPARLQNIENGKRCLGCNRVLPLERFSLHRRGPCGVQSRCKDCMSAYRGTKRRQRIPSITLTPEEAAYLAGLFDGEGYIGLLKIRHDGCALGYCYQARASVGMTTEELVGIAEETGAGRVYRRPPPREGSKPQVIWAISANHCRALLPVLLPYLRVKRQQAALVLEYLAMARRVTRKKAELLQQYLDDVEVIYWKLRALNKKGV